jgi:hypothetical protein
MIPVGYMAKNVYRKADWLEKAHVIDIYSVSSCISENFADYIHFWKHNGYWFFDSPRIIKNIAAENSIELEGTSLFYYEAFEQQFDDESWQPWGPESSFPTNVVPPSQKRLEGFDVVTFYVKNSPECSPLSCNSMAKEIPTNAHCLFASFDEAKINIDNGAFKNSEPGPYRIFAVYSVDWPSS